MPVVPCVERVRYLLLTRSDERGTRIQVPYTNLRGAYRDSLRF